MKCPKCSYLGFEQVDRCRNCGYDFVLMAPADLELSLRRDPDVEAQDLAFLDVAMAPEPTVAAPAVPSASATSARDAATSMELPLFGASIPDDLPLITRPSPPRAPLAVRRSTPEVPRLRNTPARTTLDLILEPSEPTASASRVSVPNIVGTGDSRENAPMWARLAAVVADLLILATIDLAVIYFTMQICGLGIAELSILPRAPLLAFLLVQNGGYLVVFTAGGQTLGKMAAGIKVIAVEPRASLDLGRAFIRELLWLLLAAPAGLGLLTVMAHDRRGVHDRFAGTRVVRA